MGDSTARLPSRLYYVLAAMVAVFGVVAFAYFLVHGIQAAGRDLQRFQVPGSRVFELPRAKSYTVYHEYQSFLDGKAYANPKGLPGLTLTVKSNTTGREFPARAAALNSHYEFGAYKGQSLFQFSIPEPGSYTLIADYGVNGSGSVTVLSLSSGFGMTLTLYILGSIGIMIVALMSALLLSLITWLRRRRVLRARAEQGLQTP